ncbi:MAG: AraC family transcriptional regulator [Aphanocapsa sp. GSE-SYN-MK-11-07L]|jgi:AraC-like DNA-binding protein|nr:AraC family transcriptional regulator [Aphanocapsa sp. GSE-SYN-MK-11-07L]
MTITVTEAEWEEQWEESWEQTVYNPTHEPFTEICQMPKAFGRGTYEYIEVYPEVWLCILHHTYRDEILLKLPEVVHPVEFGFMLAGQYIDGDGGTLSTNNTVISGNGIQQQLDCKLCANEMSMGLFVTLPPERLATFFPDPSGQLPVELDFLVKGDDWQTLIYPKSNPAIQRTVQEIITCPYQGFKKRLFLQNKVHDLITLQLLSVLRDPGSLPPPTRLKSSTIASIYDAKAQLLGNLEQPPSSLELANQVGLSDRTLRRGFQELFGTTVFGYLTQQRMEQAERLLRECQVTVAEVANRVGYANPSHFGAAFKRQFGITPQACLSGKKAVSRG